MRFNFSGDWFLLDGTYLGSSSGMELTLIPPPFTDSETDEGEIVLEDILDAEVVGD